MKELIELGEKQGYFLDVNGWFRNEYWVTYQGRICEKCDHCRSLEMYKEAVKSK